MADKKHYTAAELKAGPEAPMSGPCLEMATEAFRRANTPRNEVAAFGAYVVEGHIKTDMLERLRGDTIPVLADPKLPKDCKTQLVQTLGR